MIQPDPLELTMLWRFQPVQTRHMLLFRGGALLFRGLPFQSNCGPRAHERAYYSH